MDSREAGALVKLNDMNKDMNIYGETDNMDMSNSSESAQLDSSW